MKTYEFYTFIHGKKKKNGQNLIDKVFTANPDAVYVVHFRHPIERIISQYQFEWRWGCYLCAVTTISESDKNEEACSTESEHA